MEDKMLDHLLNPDSPSKDELWIEEKVEERLCELQDTVDNELPEWFQEYVDWEAIEVRLVEEFTQRLEEKKDEAAISAWEDRQAAQDAECYGW